MKKYEIDALINEQQTIILDREGKLTSTDYIAAKIAEGKATKIVVPAELQNIASILTSAKEIVNTDTPKE
jgi:hypothetical protein